MLTEGLLQRALFDVNVCYDCNFRCRYCYERDSGVVCRDAAIREDVAARYVEYLKYMRGLLPNRFLSVQFYGGEPMLHFDRVARIALGARDAADVFCIVTNGSLIERHQGGLLELNRACGGKLTASVSYDFTFQNDNRRADSYGTVRDAIRWLHGRNMLRKVITVFDKTTLPRMDEAFFDFIALREECPGLRCGYNLDLRGDLADFDEDATEDALGRIRDWLRAHPEHRGAFFHNTLGKRARSPARSRARHNHWRAEGCLLGDIVSCVDTDGGLYPEYTTLYQGEELRTRLRYGGIFDDFAALDARRAPTLAGLDLSVPEKCRNCAATCKMPLYSGYVRSGRRYALAGEDSCRIRNLVHGYMGEFG